MVASFIRLILTNFTVSFFVIGLICALVSIAHHRGETDRAFKVEAFFKYYCLWALGITSIYNALMHVVFHEMAASFIGWADSPFQQEVGFASLGMGIVGVLAYRPNFSIRLAVVIMSSVFLLGAAAGHLYQISANHNEAPGNAGVMLWTGLLQPVISLILLGLSYTSSRAVYAIKPIRNIQLIQNSK